jgi:hypothetical protein
MTDNDVIGQGDGNLEGDDAQETQQGSGEGSGQQLPSSGAERNDDTSGGDPEIVSPR